MGLSGDKQNVRVIYECPCLTFIPVECFVIGCSHHEVSI